MTAQSSRGSEQRSPQPVILCVDDEAHVLAAVQRVLLDLEPAVEVLTAASGEAAVALLERQRCDLLIVDLNMPGMGGMELLRLLPRLAPDTEAIVLSGMDDVQTVVQSMQEGASDYVSKPFDNQRLLVTVANALQKRELREQNRHLRRALQQRTARPMVGRSPAVQQVIQLVKQAARVRSNVLVHGESGTGKEVVARSVHHYSASNEEPFVGVDCAAISPALFESELFGHVRGAFTGASESVLGLLRSARRGTLFLDEITEIPLALQAKLLRVIQEREVRPVGGSQVFPFEARVVAATNRDLNEAMRGGLFREDLYFRLGVILVALPPLRERTEDIPLLVQHFLHAFSLPGEPPVGITDEALAALRRYRWLGNVRELENCIERACALRAGPSITVEDLPPHLFAGALPGRVDPGSRREAEPAAGVDLSARREQTERSAIREALERAGGKRSAAAKLLGMGRSTFYRKLKELGIDPGKRR